MAQADEKVVTASPGAVTIPSLSDQELSYASQASNEFSKCNYELCLVALSKLKTARSFDIKLLSNHAVAEYYHSGLTKTEQFKATLQELRLSNVISEDSLNTMEDDEYYYIHYNCAVVHYYTKQLSSAVAILEKLWISKDNLDENLFGKVFSLLIDLYISTYQPYKALSLADTFDDLQSKLCAGVASCPESMPEKYGPILAQQRLRCHIMTNNIEQAKKEVKLLNQNTASTQMLKASFELLKQNHKKSINLLNSCLSSWKKTKNLNAICYNNIGVNYFKLHKFNLAHLHFVKALEEGTCIWKPSESMKGSLTGHSLEILSSKKHFELLYNIGVTLLYCNQPHLAFDCLLNVVQAYPFNPRLWLRLAECCTQVYKQRNEEDDNAKKRGPQFVGTSVHRKAVLGSGVRRHRINASDSGAIPVPTLEFASLCLDNALNCLNNMSESTQVETMDESQDSSHTRTALFVSAAPSNPIKEDEVNNLRRSILLMKSFVALCLKNFIVALNAVDSLLQLHDLSGVQRYLGQMYKAEALAAVDKIAEGLGLLSPEESVDPKMFGGEKSEGSQSETDNDGEGKSSELQNLSSQGWYPYNIDQARAIKLYNCAVLWTLKGDYPKAKSLLDQSLTLHMRPLFAQMYYLETYLALEIEKSVKSQRSCIKNVFSK